MQPPKPPSQQFPHDEIARLDKQNVERLLATQTEYQSFFRKHPYFETDPVCRLARQLCIMEVGDRGSWGNVDRLVTNSGYEVHGGPIPQSVDLGPQPVDEKRWTFPDFLISGNRPRPLWMAWLSQARAAIEAQDMIETANAGIL